MYLSRDFESAFSFLSPCPTSGLIVYGKKDELVPYENVNDLNKRLNSQKGINIDFSTLNDSNHFFTNSDKDFYQVISKYIKKETALY